MIDYLTQNVDALRAYGSEMRDFSHPYSIEAAEHLARWRGAIVGCAEDKAIYIWPQYCLILMLERISVY